MEFDINIQTGLNGTIIIEDYSREYEQYIPEEQIIQEQGRYKYSESKTINVIMQVTTKKDILISVLLHNHDQLIEDPIDSERQVYDLERTRFKVTQDGYYHIHHVVLPTMEWYRDTYLNQNDEYRSMFGSIYVIDKDNKFYKLMDEEFEECQLEEIITRNCGNTTIQKCIVDVFYTGFLKQCYVVYCNKLFSKLLSSCDLTCMPENLENLQYYRDFIWMLLNIIDYQISCKQYLEAQRMLEIFNSCGGICKNTANKNEGCCCS